MADERGTDAILSGGPVWPPGRRPGLELSRLTATLANAAQRARLLVDGLAGPLTDRQRSLALDILHDLDQLSDTAGAASATLKIEPEVFTLSSLVADVVGGFRFVAHRKRLILTLLGGQPSLDCVADIQIVRSTLMDAVGAAIAATQAGARVCVEIARSADRLAVDVGAPGWDPRLPPAPPAGSGVALSVLRTPGGARLVMSVPSAA